MKTMIEVRHMEPMAQHTSWRVGGPAELFCRPQSLAKLIEFLKSVPVDTPLTFIGLGSNLLVRDGGIRGAVVCTSALPRSLDLVADGRVVASAGLPCASFARRVARLGLGPAAFFAGIPGTLGGALAMNAGAFGGETWDRVESVQTIDREGRLTLHARSAFEIGYRDVSGIDAAWFVSATFSFDSAQVGEAAAMQRMLSQRSDTQPLGRPTAGSVFRNPPGAHAGLLIEQAGLKGCRVGGALVSDKHANFIVNTGEASAADIESLIRRIQERVRDVSGVLLETEVRIIGEPGDTAL
jgi:UDP-N-acetylmuramate dehydrogenase